MAVNADFNQNLDAVDIKTAVSLVAYSADVVFVLDANGTIRDVVNAEKIGIEEICVDKRCAEKICTKK